MIEVEDIEFIGDCALILGDMRSVLPQWDDLEADLCLSDPPYPLTSGGNANGALSGCFDPSNYNNSGELFDIVPWGEMAPVIYDALAENANAVIMTSDREYCKARMAFEATGLKFHHNLFWIKRTCTPNRFYMACAEEAIFMYKGRARTISDPGSKQAFFCPAKDVSHRYLPADLPKDQRRPHPTEKPEALMAHWLMNSTDPGGLVLDPFMGAGATMVAAVKTGRRAVGIEKDPKWFDAACARVREAVANKARVLNAEPFQDLTQGEMSL